MSENIYDIWLSTVKRLARYVAYDFPDVDPEDLQQDLWEAIIKNGWTNPDDQSVVAVLRKIAKDKAAKERAEHLIISPQYSYRTSDVKRILSRVFDEWVRHQGFTHTDDEGNALPTSEHVADYDNLLVEYSDVKRAWELTPLHYRKVLFEKFALSWEFDDNGERRVRRALARLTDYLNSYQPRSSHIGPGSRREIKNARAMRVVRSDYSGDHDSPGGYDRW